MNKKAVLDMGDFILTIVFIVFIMIFLGISMYGGSKEKEDASKRAVESMINTYDFVVGYKKYGISDKNKFQEEFIQIKQNGCVKNGKVKPCEKKDEGPVNPKVYRMN